MGIWKKYPRVEFCAYGTCENKKACGDVEAAAREGGDKTANAQTGAEGGWRKES